MVDHDVEPVEILTSRQSWFDFEVTQQGSIFALAIAVIVGMLLGYLL